MEDFQLDLIIGEGPAARSVRIDLPPFTLVGATTRSGLITTPLARPLRHSAAAQFLRRRGSGDDRHPRRRRARHRADRGRRRRDRAALARHAAGRRIVCCAGCAISRRSPGSTRSTPTAADKALTRLEVDDRGLDAMDRRYLELHRRRFRRRAGRRRNHRRGAFRAARRHRGHHRALSHPAGLRAAHAARPARHGRRPPSYGAAAGAEARRADRLVG